MRFGKKPHKNDNFERDPALATLRDVEVQDSEIEQLRTNIVAQLPASYMAYRQLQGSWSEAPAVVPETVEDALDNWLSADKLTYAVGIKRVQPETDFTLVTTPSRLFAAEEIFQQALKIGEQQPARTVITRRAFATYSDAQLSGHATPEAGANFALIPSTPMKRMANSVSQQRAILEKLQRDAPFLRAPTVVEAIGHVGVLQAQGDTFRDRSTVVNRTLVRHFNLPEQPYEDTMYVPATYVAENGGLYLDPSNIQRATGSLLAIG